jgi:hypothetical protein
MNDQPGGLVDHEQEFVFVYERYGNRLGLDRDPWRRRHVDLQFIPSPWTVALAYRPTTQKYPSILDERCDAVSTQVQPVGEKSVESEF